MSANIRIEVGTSLEEMGHRFISAWRRAEAGEYVEPERILIFESWATLRGLLSPGRLSLLKDLGREPAVSMRSLARRLDRPYRRVCTDVRALTRASLIEQDGRRLSVAAETLCAIVDLAAVDA